jgi:site-specific recombinase XerD
MTKFSRCARRVSNCGCCGASAATLQAYLGHRNVQHTVRYTELSPTRFKNLWRD